VLFTASLGSKSIFKPHGMSLTMRQKKQVSLAYKLSRKLLLTAMLCGLPIIGLAEVLPDAAQPGGVEPRIQEQPRLTPQNPNLLQTPKPTTITEQPNDDVPRLKVSKFELIGTTNRPELGIDIAELNHIIELIRQDTEHGFTIEQLRHVTTTITTYYRSKGLFLARAFVPEQRIKDGLVKIQILESNFEGIEIELNKGYTNQQILKPFNTLLNQPIEKESIENALLKLNDFPGLQTRNVFAPGKQQGAAILKIQVKKEQKFLSSLNIDNHGSEFAGRYRYHFNGQLNNPTYNTDKLAFNLLFSGKPGNSAGNSLYGNANYEIPLVPLDLFMGTGYSQNSYKLGEFLAQQNINGKSKIANIYIRKYVARKRNFSLQSRAIFTHKYAETLDEQTSSSRDRLSVFNINLLIKNTDSLGNNLLSIAAYRGISGFLGAMDENGDGTSSRTLGLNQFASGSFSKYGLNYTRVQPLFRLFDSDFFNSQYLLIRTQGLYTADALVSLEQMALGGPNSVRAYPVAEALMDKAGFFSLEWIAKSSVITNVSWLQALQFSIFFDYAKGYRNQALTNESKKTSLTGSGLGMMLINNKGFNVKTELAMPIGGDSLAPKFYFSLSYNF